LAQPNSRSGDRQNIQKHEGLVLAFPCEGPRARGKRVERCECKRSEDQYTPGQPIPPGEKAKKPVEAACEDDERHPDWPECPRLLPPDSSELGRILIPQGQGEGGVGITVL